MLTALSDLIERAFSGAVDETVEDSREHGLKLATALLLIEVARADYNEDLIEIEAVAALLREYFDLTEDEVGLLVDEAKTQADHAASLQSFTRKLHEELTLEEKHRIVEMLWRVALADEHLDKHEDHLVRKVASLLYVSHADLIRIRNQLTGH